MSDTIGEEMKKTLDLYTKLLDNHDERIKMIVEKINSMEERLRRIEKLFYGDNTKTS